MSLTINVETREREPWILCEFKHGEVFRFNKGVIHFMVLGKDARINHTSVNSVFVVDLKSGIVYEYNGDDRVVKLNGELNLWEQTDC